MGDQGFRGDQGPGGTQGFQGPQGPPGSALADVSFNVGLRGTIGLPGVSIVDLDEWTSVSNAQLYNTGALAEGSGVFTAPVSGKYVFEGAALFTVTGTGSTAAGVSFFANGVTTFAANRLRQPNTGLSVFVLPLASRPHLDAGDTVRFRAQNLGSTLLTVSSPDATLWMGRLVTPD